MPARPFRTPSYRHHRPTGQAVVTLGGRYHYLGKHGSARSRAEYDRLVAEWLANGRRWTNPTAGEPEAAGIPGGLTVDELILAYFRHAETYYRRGDRVTSEVDNIRLALRPLRRLYGHSPAHDFGPLALKAVRQSMVDSGICRGLVNTRVGKVVRMFRWAVENEMVPATVHHGLKAVLGLRRGRTEAREASPVRPVPDELVDAVQPFVPPPVWAMIELQRLTGMRPGEACRMRAGEIDRAGDVWIYSPSDHKTAHHGRARDIHLGPKAQEILRPWLKADPGAFLFSPADAEAARNAERRRGRTTPMTPSHSKRARAGRARPPRDRYDKRAYHQSIARGCDRAFPHPTLGSVKAKDLTPEQASELRAWSKAHRWHPHRLRHSAATRLRREFGLDAARAVLGHGSPVVTEVYAEFDREKALEVIRQVG